MNENPNVEYFLEHFGVKGMRWGQRKARANAVRTPEQQALRAQRNARRVNNAVAVASVISIGASFMLMRQSNARISARRTPSSFSAPVSMFSPVTANRGSSFVNSAIAMGPIGSTSLPRLNGAIPL